MPGSAQKNCNQLQLCQCGIETLPPDKKGVQSNKQTRYYCHTKESPFKASQCEGPRVCALQGELASSGSNKLPLNHWWEDPKSGSNAQGVLSTFAMEAVFSSSNQSDLTFEGGGASSDHRDDACSESTPMSNTTPHKISDPSTANGILNRTSSNRASKLGSLGSAKGTLADIESSVHNEEHQANRWSEEEGKIVIQSVVYNAVLPSTDEVGLQWRISELRVALRASESARIESEQETESLRRYLAEVEAAAASLQSRVQELERLLSISSKDESKDLDKLRAKMVIEISKDARSQTAKAAQAVAAAREATMELDKVKRHASALIKAQEEETERLRIEAVECRALYNARAGQLHAMNEQIEKLETMLKVPSNASEESFRFSQQALNELQKCLEPAKEEAEDKTNQFADLLNPLDAQSRVVQTADDCLEEMEREKENMATHNVWLEQVGDLQNKQTVAPTENYYYELHKVRAMLKAEKQHPLAELASLQCGIQNLQALLVRWQNRYCDLSQQVSGIDIGHGCKPAGLQACKGSHENALELNSVSQQQALGKGKFCTDGAGLAAKPCSDEGCTHEGTKIEGLSSRQEDTARELSRMQGKKQSSVLRSYNWQRTGCDMVKDNLLAAAHKEIVRLKEINHCLMAACQDEFRSAKA